MSDRIRVLIAAAGEEKRLSAYRGENLLDALAGSGLAPDTFGRCANAGSCGGCLVRFQGAAPLPGSADRVKLTAAQLREGFRLACCARLKEDCKIELHFKTNKTDTVTGCSVTKARPRRRPEEKERAYAAVDVGTTTVAAELIAVRDGAVLDTAAFLNPQRVYGADVMSRVLAAGEGRGERMRRMLIGRLEEKLGAFARKPEYVVAVANTVMGHILLGLDPSGLGSAPFTPVSLGTERFELAGVPAFLLPGASAFIGGDITAGLIACGFAKRKRPALFLDLGTNGELVLGTGEKMLATAVAAGPAFESAPQEGGFGADRMAAIAALLREGLLQADGLLKEPYFTDGVKRCGVRICRQDIRSFQMAKAAVLSGIRLLLREYGIAAGEVERVYLAGGFGHYLKPEDAFQTGLLPEEFTDRTVAAGNTALEGAALLGEGGREEETRRLLAAVRPLNLAREEAFGGIYLDSLRLEKTKGY